MAELKEIFEMITHDTEPDLDAWEQQEQRQRVRARRRRTAALSVAAAILVVLGVFAAAALRGPAATQPATTPVPPLDTTTNLIGLNLATGASQEVAKGVAPFAAAVAPDATHLAFVRVTEGHPQIFLSSLSGGHVQQLTGLPDQAGCTCGATDPTWIDPSTLVFVGVVESGDHRLYVLDVTSNHVEPLPQGHGNTWEVAPDWSPATDQLVFAEGSWNAEPAGSGELLTMPLDGTAGTARRLIQLRGATAPDVSPDGRQIVFQANAGGGTSLYVTGASGTTRLTDGTDDTAPAWSPDGKQIAFVRDGTISILTLATGEIRELAHGGDPSWSADGSTIYGWTTG